MPRNSITSASDLARYAKGLFTYSQDSKIVPAVALFALCCLVYKIVLTWKGTGTSREPPFLGGSVVGNTYQYMTDMQGFLERVSTAQRESDIVQFRLGPKKIYMVSGERNIQAINRPSHSISADVFFLEVMANVWGAKKSEVSRFAADKSGRSKNPVPGHDVKPGEKRLWAGQHHVYSEYLQKTDHANALADKYLELFSQKLEKQPLGEWTEIRLCQFFESDMAEAALIALMGPRIVELNPGFWPAMWEFARLAPQLMWGLPQWVNRAPWKIRQEFHDMCGRYVESASENFDWDSSDAHSEWEPHYGSRMARELVTWATQNLSKETTAGMVATFIFGTNANSVPMSTWALMEILKDPELYLAVRKECLAASTTDPVTGLRTFDAQKVVSSPILQSVYIETLRLHVSINVTREVTKPITLDGYLLTAGSLIQAPSQIGAYNEAVWGTEKHPASTFWGLRNLKYAPDGRPEFTMAGKTSSFFPYGGGPSICPGRVFAKQEILMTLAMLVTRFDIEVIEWVHPDGTSSHRTAQNDQSYVGAVGIPPDRDLRVRWKRLW